MTAIAGVLSRGGGRIGRAVGRFWTGIAAVSIKELRGRMRGRRAFFVLTIYLLLLGLFALAIYVYLKQQASQVVFDNSGTPIDLQKGLPFIPAFPTQTLGNGTALSAGIGHGIFGGLLLLETLLVLVLAPAFTTGAISLEREKQTLDLLVTTPLSTLGMVIGKLFSALTYVFLLILASIPLASLVFVFGAVGPEDLLRAYVFLFALAFGMGAIGLFISAMVRRTQTATVITFVVVLLLSIGTAAVHQFWRVATQPPVTSSVISPQTGHAPEAALWLNPFVADLDMICATSPDTYHVSCDYISTVTGRPYFGSGTSTNIIPPSTPVPVPLPTVGPAVRLDSPVNCGPAGCAAGSGSGPAVASCPSSGVPCNDVGQPASGQDQQAASLGFPRDTFWPKSAAAFLILGVLLTLASAQLIVPSRRLRLRLPRLRLPRLSRRASA